MILKKNLISYSLSIVLLVLLVTGCQKEDTSIPPVISTTEVNSIGAASAICGGEITSNGGESIIARGVCWSKTANPTIDNSKTSEGVDVGSFTSSITGLAANTTYHIRAYATNSVGTGYGSDITFTTIANLPSISTSTVTNITSSSAMCGGEITTDGGTTITACGVCWSLTANPTISDSKTSDLTGVGTFLSSISELTANTTYHIRAYATNSAGTVYGSDITFKTLTDQPLNADNANMLLGNPSNATTNTLSPNNYLMVKPQYCLSYNNSKRTTNWTSWHVYSGDLGSAPRQDDFRNDNTLPAGWYQVGSSDFQFSTYGFDRGHMCPSADRTSSVANNSATFLMTNMIPQAPNNNQITWNDLEDYSRSLVNSGNELYIISGPYGQGGTSAKGTFTTLSSGVTVPSKTWKIIVVMPNGNNDLSRITTSTRVIAVVMPNDQTCSSHTWTYYRVSVNTIETLTGYDFLSNVPENIQDVVEANVDNM